LLFQLIYPIRLTWQRIFDATREKVSDLARNLEMDAVAGSGGGINIEEARQALREEDKFDKEVFRQKIKARHREERLKAKAERRKDKNPEDQDEEGQEDDDAESDVDDTVAEIIDALPDPDKVYGPRRSDSEDDGSDADVYKGPPVAK
jgi:ATP-dependent RNA helicase DDX10/DBP4